MYNTSFLENATVQDISIGLFTSFPVIIPLISIFEFFIILIVGAGINARRTGYTNVLSWATLSAITTTTSMVFISGIFSNNSEYIAYALPTIIIWMIISSVCALALFLNKDE